MLRFEHSLIKTVEKLLLYIMILLVIPVPLYPSDSTEQLAKELIRLRSEVEAKNSEVENKKQEMKARMKTISLQKTELEASIQREQLRVKQLEQTLNRKKTSIATADFDSTALKKPVDDAIIALKALIITQIPFKTAERIKELDELKTGMDSGQISPYSAVARLWSFVEDEFRLTRENGIFRQTIKIDGKEKLADVARIGTVMMFYKTSDGAAGSVKKTDSSFEYVPFTGKVQTEQVLILFDQLKKQIRTGYFEIPNALCPVGGNK
ncbi:MAG TPA: DUF3450 family protein [bacterium]|nr:DUF3450 family protein [bacterium]